MEGVIHSLCASSCCQKKCQKLVRVGTLNFITLPSSKNTTYVHWVKTSITLDVFQVPSWQNRTRDTRHRWTQTQQQRGRGCIITLANGQMTTRDNTNDWCIEAWGQLQLPISAPSMAPQVWQSLNMHNKCLVHVVVEPRLEMTAFHKRPDTMRSCEQVLHFHEEQKLSRWSTTFAIKWQNDKTKDNTK